MTVARAKPRTPYPGQTQRCHLKRTCPLLRKSQYQATTAIVWSNSQLPLWLMGRSYGLNKAVQVYWPLVYTWVPLEVRVGALWWC